MFDGLFGPWHLLILAVVVLIVVGPKKLSDRLHDAQETVQRWTDPDDDQSAPAPSESPQASAPYRVGRRLRGRRRDRS